MTKLIDILFEEREYERKKSIKKTFHTYNCKFVVKFNSEINRTQMTERIRAIKGVTVVDTETDPRMERINKAQDKYDYELVDIKFITNKNPEDYIKDLVFAMVKSDNSKGVENILGIVAAKPRLETLVKLK
jgi:hypothetical protein